MSKQQEVFTKALADYMAEAVLPVVEMGIDEASDVVLELMKSQTEELDIPAPLYLLNDMITPELIKKNLLSENENVRKFVTAWQEKTSKQLV